MTTKPPRRVAVIEDELLALNLAFAEERHVTDARRSFFVQRRNILRAELAAAQAATQAEAMP